MKVCEETDAGCRENNEKEGIYGLLDTLFFNTSFLFAGF